MPPGGSGKRKRGDRTYSQDGSHDNPRPSPHRPNDLSMAQSRRQSQDYTYHHSSTYVDRGYRGRRGGNRGGRGGATRTPNPMEGPNSIPVQSRPGSSSGTTMAPPQPSIAQPHVQRPTEANDPPTVTSHPPPSTEPIKESQNSSSQTLPHDPFDYEYVTTVVIGEWQQPGRSQIVQAGVEALQQDDPLKLTEIFQELIRSGISSRMVASEVGETVREILDGRLASQGEEWFQGMDPTSLFLDCLSVLYENNPSNPNFTAMAQTSGIAVSTLRQQLESNFLQSLGLIRGTFIRMGIRITTNILYRQANYNLLREETEGYSKLITELFTTPGSEPPTPEVVADTVERVKGMIGTFDLDVGRVLDVTMDVFAAMLVKQYRFFVKYLRASSWWPQREQRLSETEEAVLGGLPKWALPGAPYIYAPNEEEKTALAIARAQRDVQFWSRVRDVGLNAFFEIGGRRASDGDIASARAAVAALKTEESSGSLRWAAETGSLAPSGNKVAAQVLGFKLRFYSSAARDENDVLPTNLIYLAALLIKTGFISLNDLYPHLWPIDDAMEAVKEEKLKERAEREKLNRPGGGSMNALAMAGALADDTLPMGGRLRDIDGNRGPPATATKTDLIVDKAAAAKTEEKETLPQPLDQKVQLLRSLLCIGAIPESIFILGRFPWLPDAFPDLPEHIHRILHHSLAKVYGIIQDASDGQDLREPQKLVDHDKISKGQVGRTDPPARKVLRWAQLDKDDINEGFDYRFYWDDWADSIPVCQTVDDVFSLCDTFLNFSGFKIGQDTTLLLKLARIGQYSLSNDISEANRKRWYDLCKRLLVPALSLTKCNPGAVNEVFDLIQHYPTKMRYSIYAEWYTGVTSRHPDMKSAFDQTRAETRDVLKRISKTNVKSMARALAKVAYSSPGIVFSVAIGQIESYDNLVEVVVECARYFTYLGYDVLTWSLMSSLGGKGRNRVQADGMLTSRWLAALSLFAGKVFKRYSMMNPTPILQYVTEQLRQNNSTDLIILEEMTSSMAGIVTDTNFNDAQVISMAGGPLLQGQTMLQLLDRRHESRTTAKRLMKSLTDPLLAGQLLTSIAQERQTCIFKIDEEAPLKLLGNLFDETHRILTQYLDLLRSNLSAKDFDNLVPSLTRLIGEFGIDPGVAFWISRPSLSAAIKEHDDQAVEKVKSLPNGVVAETPTNPDFSMADAEIRANVNGELKQDSELNAEFAKKVPDGDADEDKKIAPNNPLAPVSQDKEPATPITDGITDPWHPILKNLMEEIEPVLPATSSWEHLSLAFYTTFWQLSLGDINVPTASYEDECKRAQKRVLSIAQDRSDLSVAGTQRKEREKKTFIELEDRLRAELRDQVGHYQATRARFNKEKYHWFPNSWDKWRELNLVLIEQCFFPRILLSPMDAVYTFKMIKALHSCGTPNFRTLLVLDQIFNEKTLTSMIFMCTAKEVENLGRFLNEILRDLSRWHGDQAVFEREAYGTKKDLLGFAKKMQSPKKASAFLTFEDFRRVLLKWHRNLHIALKSCISSTEYMHIRNAIMVLKSVHLYFPSINWMGQAQVASTTELTKTETREDLKIAAASLLGNLRRREKLWMMPQAFSLNETNATGNNRSSSQLRSTPQPDAAPPKSLNAQALEFKPTAQPLTNGVKNAAPIVPAKEAEEEDGEIEDAPVPTDTIAKSDASTMPTGEKGSFPETGKTMTASQVPSIAPSVNNSSQKKSTPELITQTPKPVQPSQLESVQSTPADAQTQSLSRSASGQSQQAESSQGTSIPPNTTSITPHSDSHRLPDPTNRGHISLPNRPEPSNPHLSDYRTQDRRGERRPRDLGNVKLPEPVRSGPADLLKERPEHVSNYSHHRYHDGPSDRQPFNDRGRPQQILQRESLMADQGSKDDRFAAPHGYQRPSSGEDRFDRSARERGPGSRHESPRASDVPSRLSRDESMAPPRLNIAQHPDRLAQIQGSFDSDRGHNSHSHDRQSESGRFDGHPGSHRDSRENSPSRRDDHRPSRIRDRDERLPPNNRRPTEHLPHSHPSSRHEDSHPPTGPRTDRTNDRSNDHSLTPAEKFREANRSASFNDPNHGRLNHEPSTPRQTESYGRLNADVPSGPRSAGLNGPLNGRRAASGSHPTVNTQIASAVAPSLPSPAPTGPALSRPPHRDFSRPSQAAAPSAPQTPVAEVQDLAGVHPDRLKQVNSPVTSGPPHQFPSSGVNMRETDRVANAPNVHSTNPMTASHPSTPTHPHAPRGPSSRQSLPTGPSLPIERSAHNRQIQGLQKVLAQANAPERPNQGTTIRGRGSRAPPFGATAENSSPNATQPSTPASTRPEPPFSQRSDLFASRPTDARTSDSAGPPPRGEGDFRIRGREGRGPREDAPERRGDRPNDLPIPSHDRRPIPGNGLLPSHVLPPEREDVGRPMRGRDDPPPRRDVGRHESFRGNDPRSNDPRGGGDLLRGTDMRNSSAPLSNAVNGLGGGGGHRSTTGPRRGGRDDRGTTRDDRERGPHGRRDDYGHAPEWDNRRNNAPGGGGGGGGGGPRELPPRDNGGRELLGRDGGRDERNHERERRDGGGLPPMGRGEGRKRRVEEGFGGNGGGGGGGGGGERGFEERGGGGKRPRRAV